MIPRDFKSLESTVLNYNYLLQISTDYGMNFLGFNNNYQASVISARVGFVQNLMVPQPLFANCWKCYLKRRYGVNVVLSDIWWHYMEGFFAENFTNKLHFWFYHSQKQNSTNRSVLGVNAHVGFLLHFSFGMQNKLTSGWLIYGIWRNGIRPIKIW